jgi:hypothetical protein
VKFFILSTFILYCSLSLAVELNLTVQTDPIFEILSPYNAYRVNINVDSQRQALKNNFVIQNLSINVESLGGTIPVESLLSPTAQKWAHKLPNKNGPNCFHTALSAIFPHWKEMRFMDEFEYMFHLDRTTKPITSWDGSSPLQFGDIITFYCAELGVVHGGIYVGHHERDAILYHKMGYSRHQPYNFMKLKDVIAYAVNDHGHSGDDISIRAFRPHKSAIDPLTEAVPSVPILEIDFDNL